MLNAQLAIEINAFGYYLHLFRRTIFNIFEHSLLEKSISELRSAFQKSESQVEELQKKSTALTKGGSRLMQLMQMHQSEFFKLAILKKISMLIINK